MTSGRQARNEIARQVTAVVDGGNLQGKAYMTPGEAAAILHVDANTLARWADLGRIQAAKTPGGHRRYLAAQVAELARCGFWSASDGGEETRDHGSVRPQTDAS